MTTAIRFTAQIMSIEKVLPVLFRAGYTCAQMKIAVMIFVLLCLTSGVSLFLVSFGLNWKAIFFFFGLGLLSILAAIAYTVGKKPYGYIGLGDFSVLIFFGLIGVMGSYYLFTKQVTVVPDASRVKLWFFFNWCAEY